jgi:hypothetical protein
VGGQVGPSLIVGDNLEWKNAQKNDMKNRISDTIKAPSGEGGNV